VQSFTTHLHHYICTTMLYILTRFILPLGFAAVGISWSLGGEWHKFLREETGVFDTYQITNYCFRGAFLVGSCGAAVGISIEEGMKRREKLQRAQAKARLISQVKTLTGSGGIPDDTRAAIQIILEDLENENTY
jgi:hypothetical protein